MKETCIELFTKKAQFGNLSLGMDKNTYETYEYLPVNNSNTESEFFVVQEDDTFLINRQVQYIAAQVQDKKEVLEGVQACTVYDVTPQQFFVDVENSPHLNLVPDNLILPEGANNLYGNSYFLQTVPSTSTGQMEQDVEQFKTTDSQEIIQETEIQEIDAEYVENNDDKQSSICTEITLSDEQYNMLEQKGWVLLETSDKVFLLDTVGLHDITNNQALIEQLQAENRSSEDSESDARNNKIPKLSPATDNISSAASLEQETVEFVIDDGCSLQNEENGPDTTVVPYTEEAENSMQINENKVIVETKEMPIKMESSELNEKVKEKPQISKDNSTIRIKTKLLLKDIPDKIVLGKTVNGKKLVAKVVSQIKTDAKKCTIIDRKPKQLISEVATEVPSPKTSLAESLEWQFEKMVREAVYGARAEVGLEHVAEAHDVVAQLLKVPAFQLAVIERNLVMTKSVRNNVGNFQTETMLSSLVSGRVTSVEGENRFVHVPDMLQKLMSEMDSGHTTGSLLKQNPAIKPKDNSVLHVHVTETKCGNTSEGVSITLNKRHLEPFRDVKRQYDRMYACSACANIFKSEEELMEHQENQCMDSEDTLTIDTEDIGKVFDENIKLNPYYILKTEQGTNYACLQCSMKFNKLSNCQRHIKTHVDALNVAAAADNEEQKPASEPTFQCKMCSSSYFHPSTLSKHIVAAHINNKVNSN